MDLTAEHYTKRLDEIKKKIDKVDTPYLAELRNVLNRIYFADITGVDQNIENLGNAFYRNGWGDLIGSYFKALPIAYVIFPRRLGVHYGEIWEDTDKNGNPVIKNKGYAFNNYARFIADVVTRKVIYSKKLERFVFVQAHKYDPINGDNDFYSYYGVDKRYHIKGFLDVFEALFHEHITQDHRLIMEPYVIAGKDWLLDIQNNHYEVAAPKVNHLYFDYFDVANDDIQPETAKNYIEMVGGSPNSQHNAMLLHAYVMKRKMKLISPEQWFLFKDFGRTGKGLFFKTFQNVFNVQLVEFENLLGGGFDASNAWRNFYGADLAHANETGEISQKQMRIIRKIATGETVTARMIGGNDFSFKLECVFALDTNEDTDIGDMMANTSRTVMIGFKDRPQDETSQERHAIFAPYWKFIVDLEGNTKIEAALAFLVNSIQYLKECDNIFDFQDVALKNYYRADQLTESQQITLRVIHEQGFILAGDELLQAAIEDDYGSLRFKKAQDDFRKIGVVINKAIWLDGKTQKAHKIDNQQLFDDAYELVAEG